MSYTGKGYDINQTFIIEAQSSSGDTPVVSACTAIYSNALFSCSGNTNIILGNGIISFNGSLYTNNEITGATIYASTYYSGGTNLFNIIEANNITGGTFNNATDTLTLNKKNNQVISVTGFSDYYTTGTTLIGNTLYFNRNDVMSAYTANLSSLSGDNTYVTGVTFTNNQLIIVRNDGVNLNTFINSFTGLTVNGNISGTTFYGDGSNLTGISTKDTFVTGGTYSNGTAVFTNNTGGTFSVSGFSTGGTSTSSSFTGGTVNGATNFTNGLTANTISATTYFNLPTFTGFYLPLSGGTVTGGTNFTNGLTANTITNTDYINFKTSPSVPSPTGGTLYYDLSENALSYKPLTNQNDVTVNLGQESLIRIYNNLGYQINNGQVLHITGATSGTPTVALANASKLGTAFIESLAQTSGVATHDIPNGQYGFMTNFGVVRDLNTTAFTVGQEVFLSDTIDGALTNNPNNIAFTSRISTVGYCLESNATTGKILVVITNENALQSLTQQEVNVLLGNSISTGVYEYTGATTASSTTINVAPMRGWLAYNTYSYATNPEVINIYYTGGTNVSLPNISSADSTYLLVNSGRTLYQQTTFPTPQQRRENIFLGKVNHPNRTSILNINNTVDYDVSPMSALRDLWSPIRLINQGIIPSPNGANLSFNTSAGTLWGNGINWANNQLSPNNVSIAAKVPASFFYRTQTGGTSSSVSVIDPRNYDVGGVITSIGAAGSDDSTNQRIYMYPTGVINVLYGQTKYTNLASAVAAIQSETFIPYPNAESTGILIGVLSVRNDIGTDGQPLTNTNYAKFTLVSKFGESFGGTGGLSTTTLQQAYDNSTTPEIVINAILDGLTIKNGTGNADNTTHLLEGLNTAGNTTSFIRADGYISGTTFQSNGFIANNNGITATTITATTYQNLPLDIRVTGGTYSNGTAVFRNNTGGTFSVSGFSTGGTSSSSSTEYWVSGSSGNFSIKTINDSGLDATGNYALAGGYGTKAMGIASYAGGYQTSAHTDYSFAMGINSIASGSSIVVSASPITIVSAITITLSDPSNSQPAVVLSGNVVTEWTSYYNNFCSQFTIYSGSSSHTIDCNTYIDIYEDSGLTYIVDTSIVSTDYNMISGNTFQNVSLSFLQPAFAIGNEVKAFGGNSFAEGGYTTAIGDYSHAEGTGTKAIGLASHAEGQSTTASGGVSHAEGQSTTASGNYSHAEGYETKAIGIYSHAEGQSTTAGGTSSHAEGGGTIASGSYSHAEGLSPIASGTTSHAEGYDTTAGGTSSHAEGDRTTALGNYSHAEGSVTRASGAYSHAEGYNSTASGSTSHAEGNFTIAGGDYSHAEGNFTKAIGSSSHAEGDITTAIGQYSHAEGYNSTASGSTSHAEGANTIASGSYSHAEGGSTKAIGSVSHAEGILTTASGDYSHTEGSNTIASGSTSHAEGRNTTAIGDYSHSEGNFTIASGSSSHAEGYYTRASGFTSHAEGANTTAIGFASHAEGSGTTSFGSVSHAEGDRTKSLGNYSHAEGQLSIASGFTSHAEGSGTTASGENSHAEGVGTTASGGYSHAEGLNTTASGSGSHAEGYNTLASGSHSHAGGSGVVASGAGSFIHGGKGSATGTNTIVLGFDINGTADNTTYVDALNIKTLNNKPVNYLGIDANNFVALIQNESDTTTINFGAAVSGETSYTSVIVYSALVTESSNIILKIIGSANHPDIEDSMIDGVVISISDIIDNDSFIINAFSSEGTWGEYDIKYLIIN